MATQQYIGARYVPLFADPADWNNTRTYEPLTIVLHEGNSFTSRQFVPKGIDISNEEYWANTGNYNAQVEQYRKEVAQFDSRITNADTTANNALTLAKTNEADIDTLDAQVSGATSSGLKEQIDAEITRAKAAEEKNASYIDKLNAYVTFNVRDYGAVGDGVTDDSNAFAAAFKAASDSVKSNYIVFSADGLQQWQANVIIPSGTYLVKNNIDIPAVNALTTKGDNRVCGINVIGQDMPTVDFGSSGNGFVINGAFFSCRNVQVQNASTAFHFTSSKYTPYIEFEDVLIRASTNGIVADIGFYMSKFVHVIGVLISDTFISCGTGGNTSVIVANCYCAGGCKIGYNMGNQVYSAMIGCACDGADVAYSFGTDVLVSNYTNTIVIGCGAESVVTNYIKIKNVGHGSCKFIGFNFNSPTSTVTEFVNLLDSPYTNLEFESSMFTAINNQFNFINKTANCVVKADITNKNIKLPGSCEVKQTNVTYNYQASIGATPVAIAKLKMDSNYGFAKLNVQCIHGTNSLQYFDYDVRVIFNKDDSGSYIVTSSGYESITSMKPTFSYDSATESLCMVFDSAKSDMRFYIKNELIGHILVHEVS